MDSTAPAEALPTATEAPAPRVPTAQEKLMAIVLERLNRQGKRPTKKLIHAGIARIARRVDRKRRLRALREKAVFEGGSSCHKCHAWFSTFEARNFHQTEAHRG